MTVINSPRSLSTGSKGLPAIPEGDQESHGTESIRPRSPTPSIPTEYHQSFRKRKGPRPRNPVSGWQARNLSNILPSGSELPVQPTRAGRRPPPESWLARQASTQIFPAIPPQNAPAPAGNSTDVNNNPNAWAIPIVLGGRRRTGRWPWQARAQSSSIFLSETENAPPLRPPRPHTPQTRHPWQERAQKSVIFECLTDKGIVPTRKLRKTYDWDQRQSKLVTEAVQQQKKEEPKSSKVKGHPDTQQPWKERAQQSVVFRSPEKPICSRPMNYNWDQRRSRFSVQLDPSAQFSKGSSYQDNYVKWQTGQDGKGIMKAAGKPCYLDDYSKNDENGKDNSKHEETISPGGGKRQFKAKSASSGEILALPAPPAKTSPSSSKTKLSSKPSYVIKTKSDGRKVKGETCLDIVPIGYRFSNHGTDSGRRKH